MTPYFPGFSGSFYVIHKPAAILEYFFYTILGRFLILITSLIRFFCHNLIEEQNVGGHYNKKCPYFSISSDLDVKYIM